jgi:hypothetical protein
MDGMGGKHTYDGSAWGDVSGWVDPAAGMLEQDKVVMQLMRLTAARLPMQSRLK